MEVYEGHGLDATPTSKHTDIVFEIGNKDSSNFQR